MAETVEQYVARITGLVGDRDPMQIISETPTKIAGLIANASDQLLTRRPAPETWSVREQIAHLADAELNISARFRFAACQPGKHVIAYDQDLWAAQSRYAEIPVDLSLTTFRALREWTVAFLRRLTQEQWSGYIEHEERGRETLPHLLRMVAGHDLNHVQQIARIVRPEAEVLKRGA